MLLRQDGRRGVFFAVRLLSASTVKRAALFLTALTLALYVLINGISTLYAVSGKFALYEFLKIQCAFCLTLIVLAVAPGQGMESGRWIASILEGFTALAALSLAFVLAFLERVRG